MFVGGPQTSHRMPRISSSKLNCLVEDDTSVKQCYEQSFRRPNCSIDRNPNHNDEISEHSQHTRSEQCGPQKGGIATIVMEAAVDSEIFLCPLH